MPHRSATTVATLRRLTNTLLRTSYRLRVRGFENVPAEGPAILAYNHVSFHDWLLVAAASPRLPRFVMHHYHFRFRALRWFFERFEAIPIAPRKEDPERLAVAMETIDRSLAAGRLVAISPEGGMTPDGRLQVFRSGVERIARRTGAPVVPIAIDGLWGSVFSRDGGEPMTKLPTRFRASVTVTAGAPIAADRVTAEHLRARIGRMLESEEPTSTKKSATRSSSSSPPRSPSAGARASPARCSSSIATVASSASGTSPTGGTR